MMYIHFLDVEDCVTYDLAMIPTIMAFPYCYNSARVLVQLHQLIQIENELLHPELRYRVMQYHAPPRLVYVEDVSGIPTNELIRLRQLVIELIHICEEYYTHWNHPDWEVLSSEIESIYTRYA